MGDVLSQNEIDNLLAALSTGELDVSDINDGSDKPVKTMISVARRSSPRSICVPWKLYLNITAD